MRSTKRFTDYVWSLNQTYRAAFNSSEMVPDWLYAIIADSLSGHTPYNIN